jgi:signal transduction histidine kinase
LSEFIAHLCHEIRNPLSGIYGNLEITQDYLKSIHTIINRLQNIIPLAERTELTNSLLNIEECITAMITCTEYEKNILDDNLDMAKIAEKKFTLENKVFNFQAAMREVVHMLKAKAAIKGIVLNLNLPDEQLLVKGDIARIKQITINLVGNAIKFTEKGSVTITLAIQAQELTFTQFAITVTDTGIGLEQNEIDSLFQRFAQANFTRKNLK